MYYAVVAMFATGPIVLALFPIIAGLPRTSGSDIYHGLRKLINKQGPRNRARNALDEEPVVPVVIPEMETSSESEASSEADQ